MIPELTPCPVDSFFVRRHPELLRDYVRRPFITKGRRGGRFFCQECCPHSRFPGAFASPQEIAALWEPAAAALLETVPAAKRADLEEYENRLQQFGTKNT